MPETIATSRKSQVAFCKVKEISKHGVIRTVEEAVNFADCDELKFAKKLFVKVNLLSQEVVPGQCTSPWVFEGVLKYLRKYADGIDICYGDCNVAAASQVEVAVINWGLKEIGDRYGASFVNLSKTEQKERLLGPVLGKMRVPAFLLDVDAIITVPVIKTHCITPFTGALKNQWGLLPRARFQYHDVVHEAIAEINHFFNQIVLGVADLTIGMEGPGPRVGIPKICDLVIASTDLVALDALASLYMGMDPLKVGFINFAEKLRIGSTEYDIVGDTFEKNYFRPGVGKDYLVYRWRDRFKKMPVLKQLLFTVPAYRALGYCATKYNLWAWYKKTGKMEAERVCSESGYGAEFETLIKNH